ncbi:MAG: phosphoadenosine phosphosulfate reductase family protein [Veillonella parvula]|uniref:Phosphoadenosine phosphosulfate reductase family protein n=1 Tax=Veillonella parvula TaxID=29466 RepID=A0A942WS47_VEIPA|nr:phosphoadenosine phosphosulfate reductase family protein [Veillonella parvula]MBS4893808.1 phosphoadenosine phosphosulfate reductase family protein [Veillonella parvula]
MKLEELRLLQNYPLELKIAKSKARIQEFINHFGVDGVYISFSGGKDSTVLLHLVRSLYPNVEAVFSNTGLEFPEITKFVKTKENVTMVKPEKSFAQVIKDCGYPIISKKTARMIRDCQNPTEKNQISRQLYLSDYAIKNGKLTDIKNNSFKIAKKWRYLIDSDIPISHKCCDILKKNPMKKYEKESKKRPIIGTMANESKMRESSYLTRGGCNSFDEKKGSCLPLSFWTEQDIFEYILKFNLEYASVYGEIIKDENNKWTTTGEKRTGCYACGFFRTKDQLKERFDRMSETHPKLYNYCLKGGRHDDKGRWIPEQGLGYEHLFDVLNIDCGLCGGDKDDH